jgi:pimeloyl-ACP methyl ester carboxylesterase
VTTISHRTVRVQGLDLPLAEAGEGPLVLLLHGFPEFWYSWRRQLIALAEAGFHAVAPDQRGYGPGAPAAIEDYDIFHLVGDVVGLLAELGEPDATVIGHDWGAMVSWHTALFRPDLVRGVGALSVPFRGRAPKPPLDSYRAVFGPNFYQLYFSEPGVAEKELAADLDDTFRRFLYGLSGDAPEVSPMLVGDSGLLRMLPRPESLPAWLGEGDLAAYVERFAGNDFFGPLNWYRTLVRNWELTAPWAGADITVPALFLAGDRDPVVNWGPQDQLEAAIRRRVPRLQHYELLPGAGHWVQQERPAETNQALVEFARSTRQAGGS